MRTLAAVAAAWLGLTGCSGSESARDPAAAGTSAGSEVAGSGPEAGGSAGQGASGTGTSGDGNPGGAPAEAGTGNAMCFSYWE